MLFAACQYSPTPTAEMAGEPEAGVPAADGASPAVDARPADSATPDAPRPDALVTDAAVSTDAASPDAGAPVDAPLPLVPDAAADRAPDVAAPAPDVAAPAPDVAPDRPPPDLAPDLPEDRCHQTGRGPRLVFAGSFCIDATEVTNRQYKEFLDGVANDGGAARRGQPAGCSFNDIFDPSPEDSPPWPPPPARAEYPVVSVNWCDAAAFCTWAGKHLCRRIGGGTLAPEIVGTKVYFPNAENPALSEWAAACAGPSNRKYPYGDDYKAGACNLARPGAESWTLIDPVGTQPNCEGGYPELQDMSGNVEEWVDSCTTGKGATDKCAVIGGGPFNDPAGDPAVNGSCAQSSYGGTREDAYKLRGFRCCGDLR